ncbi:MAG: THUMP domain-containing protein, partial [Candidatus Woesearchaeota archaeon]
MKYLALVNSGLSELCQEELKELGIKSTVEENVIKFDVKDENLLKNLQSTKRVLRFISEFNADEDVEIEKLDYLNEKSFKIEVENLKGQENRFEIANKIGTAVFKNVKTETNYKKPDFLLVAYHQDGKFYLGLDIFGEMHKREYRLFPHSASFTGDYAYYFIKKVGFSKGNKLLVGFFKDGGLAIEAAIFSKENIYAFDPSSLNYNAAKKNAKLAGVDKLIDIKKCSLEDLDVKYENDFFDNIIFHLTAKDEGQINEIYSQTLYVLKKKGKMLIITRESFELSVSDKFKLIIVEDLKRGESVHKLW